MTEPTPSEVGGAGRESPARRALDPLAAEWGGEVARRRDELRWSSRRDGRPREVGIDRDHGTIALRIGLRNTVGVLSLHREGAEPDEDDEADVDEADVDEDRREDREVVEADVFLEEPPTLRVAMRRTLEALGRAATSELLQSMRGLDLQWLEADADHLAAELAPTLSSLRPGQLPETLRTLDRLVRLFEREGSPVAPRPRVFVAGQPIDPSALPRVIEIPPR